MVNAFHRVRHHDQRLPDGVQASEDSATALTFETCAVAGVRSRKQLAYFVVESLGMAMRMTVGRPKADLVLPD